jgi:TetR/AcrR family transcriptional repressor of nem operon
VREALLAAGQELIHGRGVNGSGVKDYTDAAGVPKGSFYSYFDSKEAFVIAVVEQHWQAVDDAYGPILRDSAFSPTERLVRYFRALADDFEVRDFALGCLIGNITLEVAPSSTRSRRAIAGLFERWEGSLVACLRDAQAAGELAADRDVEELAALLIEAWEGAAMHGKVGHDRRPYDRFETVVLPRLLS